MDKDRKYYLELSGTILTLVRLIDSSYALTMENIEQWINEGSLEFNINAYVEEYNNHNPDIPMCKIDVIIGQEITRLYFSKEKSKELYKICNNGLCFLIALLSDSYYVECFEPSVL